MDGALHPPRKAHMFLYVIANDRIHIYWRRKRRALRDATLQIWTVDNCERPLIPISVLVDLPCVLQMHDGDGRWVSRCVIPEMLS